MQILDQKITLQVNRVSDNYKNQFNYQILQIQRFNIKLT